MKENLQGIHKTIDYGTNTIIRLDDNQSSEFSTLHWHDALEIILPLSNAFQVISNNETYTITEGELLFIQPSVNHQLVFPSDGRRIIFQISLNHLYFIDSFKKNMSLLPPIFAVTKEAYPYESPILFDEMMEILEEYRSTKSTKEISIFSKILTMLVLLSEHQTMPSTRSIEKSSLKQEYMSKFSEICEYVDSHLTENLTLDDMAKMAGFSKFHFTRLFKQFTNYSFYQYVNVRRIHHAQLLLVNPNMTVTEAAYQSGFSNTSAFDRMFKLHKNCTPTEFRKLYQKQ